MTFEKASQRNNYSMHLKSKGLPHRFLSFFAATTILTSSICTLSAKTDRDEEETHFQSSNPRITSQWISSAQDKSHIGRTLHDLGSSENIRSIAKAMVQTAFLVGTGTPEDFTQLV